MRKGQKTEGVIHKIPSKNLLYHFNPNSRTYPPNIWIQSSFYYRDKGVEKLIKG
jgi:hypothetical protein